MRGERRMTPGLIAKVLSGRGYIGAGAGGRGRREWEVSKTERPTGILFALEVSCGTPDLFIQSQRDLAESKSTVPRTN
jgi:hypothetical protein